jgi:diacylglycerol kinase (ATP)
VRKQWGVRPCVIFNPTAKGEKARRFRHRLDALGSQCAIKLTAAAGDARRLAALAVAEGFDTIVAAGGDGTLNEVINGIGAVPDGFERARVGLLPLGTVNVFARELGIPGKVERAWEILSRGRETIIDLPWVQFGGVDGSERRCFAQLAGAGLDARAIELVKWDLKKKIGPLAYVMAGMEALRGSPAVITAAGAGHSEVGALVLIGNGRLYGGPFEIFPKADLRDGQLEVCVFPRITWLMLAVCGPSLVLRGKLPASIMRTFRAETVTLTSTGPVPFEVDGELAGHLPAMFSMERARLRVIVP